MIVCLILIGVLLVLGTVLKLFHKEELGNNMSDHKESAPLSSGDCCGMHEICEKQNNFRLEPAEYYDDEELDRFAGRAPEDYESSEIEEFRNILMTLLPDDIAGWGASIEKRGVSLPSALRDEYMLLLSDIGIRGRSNE